MTPPSFKNSPSILYESVQGAGFTGCYSPTKPDVSDRYVEATALLVINQHGDGAVLYAAQRAEELLGQGAITGAKTWPRILVEIERMRKMEPEGG